MLGMLAAMPAIFGHHQFFGCVDFIACGDVVLVLAHCADQCTEFTLIFLGHGENYTVD